MGLGRRVPTLVLINGKRRHRAAVIYWLGNGVADGAQGPDISAIPGIELRQVEVLRDGACGDYQFGDGTSHSRAARSAAGDPLHADGQPPGRRPHGVGNRYSQYSPFGFNSGFY